MEVSRKSIFVVDVYSTWRRRSGRGIGITLLERGVGVRIAVVSTMEVGLLQLATELMIFYEVCIQHIIHHIMTISC